MHIYFGIVCTIVALTFATLAPAGNRVAVTDINSLKTGGAGGALNVSVSCYYPAAISAICSGGGIFDGTATSCSSGDNNNATIIYDSANSICYYRKDFGLNGVVDARQCGVIGTGNYSDQDAVALQNCLDLAKTNHIPIVDTGGGRVRDDLSNGDGSYGQDVVIPEGIMLTCGGGTALGLVTDNNYSNSPEFPVLIPVQHVIILDGAHTLRPKSTDDGDGSDNGSSAGVDGCVFIRADDNGTDTYAPSLFHPKNNNGGLRSSLNVVSGFRGTAVTANSESFAVRNSTILGFAQCWKGMGNRLTVQNVKCDGTAGIWAAGSGGGISIDNVQIRPYLTGNGFTNAHCSNCTSYAWQYILSGQQDFLNLQQDTSNNEYEVTLDVGTDTTKAPVTGDTIWVGTPTTNAQSASGRYTLAAVSGPSSCGAAHYCVTFDLPGSVYTDSYSANYVQATATFSAGSNVLTGLTGMNFDVRKLAVGMHVGSDPSSGCIHDTTTATATIVDINPAWNTVWINQATPAICDSGSSGSSNIVRFWDDGYASPSAPIGATVTLSATERTGDAYKVTDSGGVTFSNCRQVNHYVGFHAGNNSNLTRFVNCANDNDSTLQDDGLIGLLCDGEHYGLDCADTNWVNGALGQHATGSIVISSDSNHGVRIANSGVGGLGTGRQRGRVADVEAGVLALDNSSAGSGDHGNVV